MSGLGDALWNALHLATPPHTLLTPPLPHTSRVTRRRDIIDTGLTMSTLVKRLRQAGAMSVRVVVLLDKRARRQVTYDADYVGIQCPDEFVVGYGERAAHQRHASMVGPPVHMPPPFTSVAPAAPPVLSERRH